MDNVHLDASAVAGTFLDAGFGPFTGVPCSFLGPLISALQTEHPDAYFPAANEGEAVAISAGARLAGRRPVVILQNSGLGNTVNPLTSLCHTLRLPVLLLVTWRGRPGHPDEPQHRLMGRITPELLTSMEIRHEQFPADPGRLAGTLRLAQAHMEATRLPYALIVPKGTLAPYRAAPPPAAGRGELMLRADAIGRVVKSVAEDALIVATTGKTARELERDWDRAGNLYVVGSMGCASSVGLGVALGAPDREVVVLDGDGAALMRLESLTTIGRQAPPRLLHILLDNESYESTGGQPTVSGGVDFCAIASACGYRSVAEVSEAGMLTAAVARARTRPGPHLVRVRIRPGSDPSLGRPALTPPEVAARFAAAAATATAA
ncbi:phosphonopyruvate decarboxylase [Streptomyces acidiscabies]|uniref:phosphonopyruvate decarboxylase n=1 Tax=Streptomyces acidiscabies TaxID=42234 RepID=UPI00073E8592|nr:phosphonopyruvate decarboxylase [Streptomyces acidiscabies]GAQ51306.1 acetolactate synthase isozyme 1 large subunit [Streptomyces acidiscabies]